jgi:hypothetical protein
VIGTVDHRLHVVVHQVDHVLQRGPVNQAHPSEIQHDRLVRLPRRRDRLVDVGDTAHVERSRQLQRHQTVAVHVDTYRHHTPRSMPAGRTGMSKPISESEVRLHVTLA